MTPPNPQARINRLRAALVKLWKHTAQIDNGRCAVCRVGFRTFILPSMKPGPCSDERCLSHVVIAALADVPAEAVTTDGEKLLDIVHCDKCGRQRASNASHFNACPYCSFGNILAEAEIPCPNAGDPSYGVDYGSGHGHICELCRGTGTVLSPTAEAVETRKEWRASCGAGANGDHCWEDFREDENRARHRSLMPPESPGKRRWLESRTITATPWTREKEKV